MIKQIHSYIKDIKYTKAQLENYLIDCIGYSEEDCKEAEDLTDLMDDKSWEEFERFIADDNIVIASI